MTTDKLFKATMFYTRNHSCMAAVLKGEDKQETHYDLKVEINFQ